MADWLISEVRRLNIDVQLNTFAEEEEVLALSGRGHRGHRQLAEPDEYEGAEPVELGRAVRRSDARG